MAPVTVTVAVALVVAPLRAESSALRTVTVLVKAPTPWLVERVSPMAELDPATSPAISETERFVLSEEEMVLRLTRNPLALATVRFVEIDPPKPMIALLRAIDVSARLPEA